MAEEGAGEPAAEGPEGGQRKRRRRLVAGYATVGLAATVGIVGLVVLSSDSTPANRGNPHINVSSGATHGVPPDGRAGIEPGALPEAGLRAASREADCELHLHLPDEGHGHIPSDAPEPRYRTNPPTSGSHIDEQQADGAYRSTPRPASVVHSLEHGRLAIQYRQDLAEQAQLELIGLFDEIHSGSLIFPDPDIPFAVAAATWTNLIRCPDFQGTPTLVALREFGRATWGKYGGESLLGLRPGAPTPASHLP